MTNLLSNELYINDLQPVLGIGFRCGRTEKRGETATS